ncbi:MAG: S9 family peptidase [Candidatus Symbiothrix sp.]|jgi:dipeptidyl aminopeptidase/acylaminoacyl peptidase|nr:S9 family peptidase [Candidatus Symbiothrix sp.]
MKKIVFTLMTTVLLFSACKQTTTDNDETIIGKTPIEVKDGRLTAEILHQLGQISGVSVAPNGKTVLYGVSYCDIALNKRNRELFTVNIDGTNKKQITQSAKSEGDAQWIENGKKIAFIYDGQIWEMNVDGSNRTQISQSEQAIETFRYSPDGKNVLFISTVQVFKPSSEVYSDLDKSSGKIIDNLMYKHWDEWVERIPHPFVADYDGKSLSNITDILEGEPYESPMRPWGGIEQLDWSPDSKTIAYTSRKKTGKEYAESTNSDIYLYNIETKEHKNLTEGMMGYDMNPKFSPDGKFIAWQSMERDGYESDLIRLFSMNLETGEKEYLTKDFDYNVDDFCWDKSLKQIFFVACVKGTTQLFLLASNYDKIRLTNGDHDYATIAVANGCLVGLRHSLSCPNEIFTVLLFDGTQRNISHENDDVLAQITMGKVEERWIETTTKEQMLTWVVYPPDFDASKKYPAILYCQGGPQSTVSQFWSTRWNLQLMAAHGYIVVAPNRRGVPGFGQAWNEQISGDYGGQNIKDCISAIDALAKEPFVDETRLGCTGASYGGFSVYWLAGNHNKRFKAFWAHAGIFNFDAQYLETEEMWFVNWDLGGAFWDKSNKIAQNSYANSPHNFIEKWDTPIAVSHGALDFRILASQGMQAFNAAQLRGIPSRMLIFPNENHWILQPQNGILFQREFFRWFDEWLK